MHHQFLPRGFRPALIVALSIALVLGCGDDKSTGPAPQPDLGMSVADLGGLPTLTVRNSGGAMSAPSAFVVVYGDGSADTLPLQLTAHDSISCVLSNIHGCLSVGNEDWDLADSLDDCLFNYFENVVSSVDFNGFVPSPLTTGTYLTCNYSIYLTNLAADTVTFEMTPTDSGLTLTATYHDITGHLAGTAPGALCPDFTGTVSMTSIVVKLYIVIGAGDDPPITIGGSQATVNGLQVDVDGLFGFVVEWITGSLTGSFVAQTEAGIEEYLNTTVGSDLSGLVIVHSSCAQ